MTFGSRAFFEDFLNEFEEDKKNTNWVDLFEKKKERTEKMLGTSDSRKKGDYGLLGKIGKKYGYTRECEWLKVDLNFHNDMEDEEFLGFIPWKTDVLIEHENNPTNYVRTLLKLGETSTPLKIVFFYPKVEEENEFIETGRRIIKNLPVSYPGGVYLLVFGFCDDKKGVYWKAYEIDWKGNIFPISKIMSKN